MPQTQTHYLFAAFTTNAPAMGGVVRNKVAFMKSPYRTSIWDWKTDTNYSVTEETFNQESCEIISRLAFVDAAKKNVPPIAINDLLRISNKAKELPESIKATAVDIQNYLDNTKNIKGAGTPTLICMLAIETGGDYAPIDRKFVSGLVSKNIITKSDRRNLMKGSAAAFSNIYIDKVLPAWRESKKHRTPKEADCYWGNGGKDVS